MPIKVAFAADQTCRGARYPMAAVPTPSLVVGLLLLACCAKGVWSTMGVEVPPDPDTVRDLGFIQGFLDGNWLGDPAIEGGWRWYPPLLHGLAALVIGGLHLPLLRTWLHAGALLNLLTPLSFYLMNRRLIGPEPGAAATAVMVLFDGVLLPGDATVGYTPWTLTPALAWPLFFASVWLIAERVERLRIINAIMIGSALGLVFLAHTVPALLLSGITVGAALAAGGWRRRTLFWLAVVALMEFAWTIPLLLPLLVAYHLHIANPGPGDWEHPALRDPATLLPNLIGLLALAWLVASREWARLPRVTAAILSGWIVLCLLFLSRHYACSTLVESGGLCGTFVVAAHHYHVYLQAAWATLFGFALVRVWHLMPGSRQVLLPVAILAAGLGLVGLLAKPEDQEARRLGSTRPEMILDRDAYDWMLSWTNPGDLFVTELPDSGADMGVAAASVIAAGRRLVAPPEYHANPYVPWKLMNARRVAYLAARTDGDLCPLLRQAGKGTPFFLLASGRSVSRLVPMFSGRFHTVFRVPPEVCQSTLP